MLTEVQDALKASTAIISSVCAKPDFLKSNLRERGWTDGMIHYWLGEPRSTNRRWPCG